MDEETKILAPLFMGIPKEALSILLSKNNYWGNNLDEFLSTSYVYCVTDFDEAKNNLNIFFILVYIEIRRIIFLYLNKINQIRTTSHSLLHINVKKYLTAENKYLQLVGRVKLPLEDSLKLHLVNRLNLIFSKSLTLNLNSIS
jgi:hypothetical protein